MRLFSFLRKWSGQTDTEPAFDPSALEVRGMDTLLADGVEQRVFLQFQEGKSHKVYHLEMRREADGLFSVHVEYGRRGNPLQAIVKTEAPVSREEADKVFQSLWNEKPKKDINPTNTRK